MKTLMPNIKDRVVSWNIVDAKDQILGRFATRVASRLRGKDSTLYAPHFDPGCGIVVINASQIRVTGNKKAVKTYKSYSAYPGGLKETTLEKMLSKRPEYVIRHAVKGMLPKNKLADQLMKRLKVYAGADHPHAAQTPKPIEIK
ncbi:MAG: 50S ribosomal protein L13 [Candidatus Omnitrophota bacterium]